MEEKGETDSQRRRSFANVTAIERVLTVLEAINRMPTITVKRISNECNVPPATVVRILETLCAKGYLVHLSRRAGYSLTSRVKALSAGYHGPPLVVERLSKYADALTMQHLWPFSIATLEHDVMVVQYTAMELSPLGHVRTTLHRRLSLVGRAYGIAYLAFCSSIERHHLARIILTQDYPEKDTIKSMRDWKDLIMRTRARGYAIRPRNFDPTTSTIAVPIMISPGRVAATIGMTFFRRSLRPAQVAGYASILKATAKEAGEELHAAIIARQEETGLNAPSGLVTG